MWHTVIVMPMSLGERGQFLLPQPQPVAVGAAGVGGDQQFRRSLGRCLAKVVHQRRIVATAKAAVSPSLPTVTQPASAPRS